MHGGRAVIISTITAQGQPLTTPTRMNRRDVELLKTALGNYGIITSSIFLKRGRFGHRPRCIGSSPRFPILFIITATREVHANLTRGGHDRGPRDDRGEKCARLRIIGLGCGSMIEATSTGNGSPTFQMSVKIIKTKYLGTSRTKCEIFHTFLVKY